MFPQEIRALWEEPAGPLTELAKLIESKTGIYVAIEDMLDGVDGVSLSDPLHGTALIAAGIPIILQTGIGLPAGLSARFPDLAVHIKPCVAADLVLPNDESDTYAQDRHDQNKSFC